MILSIPTDSITTTNILPIGTSVAASLISLIIPGRVGISATTGKRKKRNTVDYEPFLKVEFCDKISTSTCNIQDISEVEILGSSYLDFIIVLTTTSTSPTIVSELKTLNENIATGGRFTPGVISGK